jgi:membrane protein DedA with SNARE-associated domain
MTAPWWTAVGAALGAGFVSGAVTIALAEATALGAGAVPSSSLRIAVIVAFTLGHVAGKGLWYWAGTQERRITRPSLRRWIDRAHTLAAQHPTLSLGVIFTSAAVSLPPFHLTAVTAGIVRTPAVQFFALAFVGRLLRFGLIAWAGMGVFGDA